MSRKSKGFRRPFRPGTRRQAAVNPGNSGGPVLNEVSCELVLGRSEMRSLKKLESDYRKSMKKYEKVRIYKNLFYGSVPWEWSFIEILAKFGIFSGSKNLIGASSTSAVWLMCPSSKLSQVSAVTHTATRGAGEYLFINLDEFDHDLWPKNVVFCHWNDWTWIRGIIHLAFIDCMIIIFSLLNYSTYNWARLAQYLGEILRCRTFKKLFDIVWRVPQLTASKNEELFGDHDTVYLWKDWPLCPIRSSEEARENGNKWTIYL